MLGSSNSKPPQNVSSKLEDSNSICRSNDVNHHRYNVHSRYQFVRTLGKGTYGKVKLAIEKYTGRKFAVKTLRKDRIKNKKDMMHIRREMKIMSSLRHPNIIQIHEVFENPDKFVIVMEYAPKGELYEYLSSRKIDSVDESRVFFKQMVSAIQYCHQVGVVHRDLKLENILLGANYEIKIADFGLANLFKSGQLLDTYCGSPLYASPEIVNGIPYTGPEVDTWSLGVLLYALVYNMMPFDGSDYNTLTRQISHGKYLRQTTHLDVADLIEKMLTVDPLARATIEQIASHSWLTCSDSTLSSHTMSPVGIRQENPQAVDTNANYIHPFKHDLTTGTLDNSNGAHPSPALFASPDGKLSRTVLTPCALENCAHLNCPLTQRKGILKHINPEAKPTEVAKRQQEHLQTNWHQQCQVANMLPPPVSNINLFVNDIACGLQAKDSLKLKTKPLGASGKRRVLRSKRDRESGYYSSPERTPVDVPVQVPATVYQYSQPIMKPPLSSVTTDSFKPRHPHQQQYQDSILSTPYCGMPVSYVVPMVNVNHQTVPIIEGQPLSFYPTIPITVNSAIDHRMVNALPYTLAALNSEESQQKRGRPVSTYSDSSILSSDSFELCSFDSPLSTTSYYTTVANNTANTIVNMVQSRHVVLPSSITRPCTLPMSIPTAYHGRCSPEPSGTLTPTSAKLNHDLSQILAPNNPRRRYSSINPEEPMYESDPPKLGEEQADQLREMMKQLNLDLERACKKGLDVKVSLTASAEV